MAEHLRNSKLNLIPKTNTPISALPKTIQFSRQFSKPPRIVHHSQKPMTFLKNHFRKLASHDDSGHVVSGAMLSQSPLTQSVNSNQLVAWTPLQLAWKPTRCHSSKLALNETAWSSHIQCN